MKRNILLISLLIIILNILTSCELYGNKDLGNKLTLWASDSDKDYYDIVYCSNYDIGGCTAGMYVIPETDSIYYMYVETAKSNKNWVIAKTIRIENKQEKYWIISKDFDVENLDCFEANCDSIIQSHVIGPLEYGEFRRKLKNLRINLHF